MTLLLLLAVCVCLMVAGVAIRDALIDHGEVLRELERRDRLDEPRPLEPTFVSSPQARMERPRRSRTT
jgi:hypothetical protein